jgi:predicted dehydrogenase
MKIAFVGCGYVFDIYMRSKWAYPELEVCGVYDTDTARSAVVSKHYGFRVYPSYEALLADPDVQLVVNLTTIRAHYEVIARALDAGKHVYSEKPLTLSLEETRELLQLAEARGRVLTGAPPNLYSDSICTLWKAVRDGAIGKPVLVYAELDDNPAHLMQLDKVQSPTGAPFPYAEELQEGCTVEHVAYHLVWLCAMFGPVTEVTAFSKNLVADKRVPTPLSPPDTPDLSVACLSFANGLAARVTCSWVAPRDHRFRVIGEEGEITVDNIFHDQSRVRLEHFSRVSLSARKAYQTRTHPTLGRLLGIGGRRLPLVRRWKSHGAEERPVGATLKTRFVSWLRRHQVYATDKFIGVAEMVRALEEGRPQPLSPEFLLHLNELTLMIHRAGPQGATHKPSTTFERFDWLPDTISPPRDYRATYRPKLFEKMFTNAVVALHRR